jgi:hypothetical protein
MRAALKITIALALLAVPATAPAASHHVRAINCGREQYKPTCSAGAVISRPVTVTLSRPKACPGRIHPAFGRATFTFPSGTPPYAYHRFTFRCPF